LIQQLVSDSRSLVQFQVG